MLSAADVIRLLELRPHPEGGHYRQTFRDGRLVHGERPASTAIYFLLARGERSHWHKVDAVEVWHYHAGAPLMLEIAAQRQLNDQGRELARSIGDSMRKLKIPVGQVITSMFNRAVETGTLLGFGAVTTTADVSEGGLVVTPIENNRRTQAMRKLAATAPPAGSNVIVVSHKPNIMDAFGKDWFDVREGEASAFKPDGSGAYKLVVRVQANEWGKLAQMSAN